MNHRPANPLNAALLCLVGLVLTGVTALILPVARLHDSATLEGFAQLRGTRLDVLANQIARTVDPRPYVVLGVVLAARRPDPRPSACRRGRPGRDGDRQRDAPSCSSRSSATRGFPSGSAAVRTRPWRRGRADTRPRR